MSIDPTERDTLQSLAALLESGRLSPKDALLGEQCGRRLQQPLRLIVFGTDVRHAVSLLNVMTGFGIAIPKEDRTRIQFVYGAKPFAAAEYSNGTSRDFGIGRLDEIHDDQPTRIKIGADLPVLKKVSFMVAADTDADALCKDVEQSLLASDIALFAGAGLSDPIGELWSRLPVHLKDHSYLVLSPDMDMGGWSEIDDGFVDVITVDPVRAQDAKNQEGGPDKDAFRASGGADVVKSIKRELDVLRQSSLDAADILLERYGADLEVKPRLKVVSEQPPGTAKAESDVAPESAPAPKPPVAQPSERPSRPVEVAPEPDAEAPSVSKKHADRVRPPRSMPRTPSRREESSAPQSAPDVEAAPKKDAPEPEAAAKPVAPKKVRAASPKRPRPAATPWSLDL